MMKYELFILQIPDVRTGDDIIDAVVVDKESVGSEGRGGGAKILYGKGSFERYFSQHKVKDSQVWPMVQEPTIFSSHISNVIVFVFFITDAFRSIRRGTRG